MAPDPTFSPSAADLLARNVAYAADFNADDLPAAPSRRLAVVACMDARMDVYRILGIAPGDAHVIRNAGGVVTDDVIRSLCLSQRLLETCEIMLLHHTGCGLESLSEDAFKAGLEVEIGLKPPWAVEGFDDPFDDVRQSIRRLIASPFILHKEHIDGYVYDVGDGTLREVDPSETPRRDGQKTIC